MNNRNIEYWVIPPECDAEFVASMEDVLETYEKPYSSVRQTHATTPLGDDLAGFSHCASSKFEP